MEDACRMAPTVQDGWLVWEVPGKPVSVRLSLDVVSRLGMAVQEGFKALPRRGLEIGGLLIGTARDAGTLTVVDVDDFEPVESEHATGPSYVLSDADRRLLKERIAAREAAPKLPPVVGFYRSHSRKDFAITADDASLFSTYCTKASDVFLLIKSNEVGPPTGGFIIREGGKSPVRYPLRAIRAGLDSRHSGRSRSARPGRTDIAGATSRLPHGSPPCAADRLAAAADHLDREMAQLADHRRGPGSGRWPFLRHPKTPTRSHTRQYPSACLECDRRRKRPAALLGPSNVAPRRPRRPVDQRRPG